MFQFGGWTTRVQLPESCFEIPSNFIPIWAFPLPEYLEFSFMALLRKDKSPTSFAMCQVWVQIQEWEPGLICSSRWRLQGSSTCGQSQEWKSQTGDSSQGQAQNRWGQKWFRHCPPPEKRRELMGFGLALCHLDLDGKHCVCHQVRFLSDNNLKACTYNCSSMADLQFPQTAKIFINSTKIVMKWNIE